jgi:hypothetical protein
MCDKDLKPLVRWPLAQSLFYGPPEFGLQGSVAAISMTAQPIKVFSPSADD